MSGKLSKSFRVRVGVPQGSVISPLLFIVFVNSLLIELEESGLGLTINSEDFRSEESKEPNEESKESAWIGALMYADDLCIAADSEEKLKQMSEIVENWTNRFRMKCNAAKCGLMIIGAKSIRKEHDRKFKRNNAPSRPICTYAGVPIPRVKQYEYLGVMIAEDANWSLHLKHVRKKPKSNGTASRGVSSKLCYGSYHLDSKSA